jgi:signal transduction histidine kinase
VPVEQEAAAAAGPAEHGGELGPAGEVEAGRQESVAPARRLRFPQVRLRAGALEARGEQPLELLLVSRLVAGQPRGRVEIFSNLIDNAIRHSSGPINVWIRVSTVFESGREYHRIDIEDNGPGIPDQVKEQIFTRAWRGRTKAVGKGLGLFLVRRLVEDFDGRVWVEDRIIGDPTKGSRFVVLLPTAECAT